MTDCMSFPKEPMEFIKGYSFVDSDEVYTNGSELVPLFRVEQMLEHYLNPLKDKQEQGLLIDVPVKPGDDIYFIKLHFNGASRLGKITIDKITIDAFEIRVRGFWYDWNQEVSFTLKEFNKTWFLTKAKAEEALAKMGGK